MTGRTAGATAATGAHRTGRLTRRVVVLLGLGASLLLLLTAVLPWVRATAPSALTGTVVVEATGTGAAPLVPAAALVGVAAALALTLVGRVGGIVVGGVLALAGLLGAVTAGTLVADPGPPARSAAAQQTGVAVLDGAATVTAWPVLAVVLGVTLLAAGVLAVRGAPGWSADARHERRTSPAGADGTRADGETGAGATGTAAASPHRAEVLDDRASWDALSNGDDPS